MVKELLRSLDNSFDTLILMIKERPRYKDLEPTDVLERLNAHELQEEGEGDLYGSNYRKSHALKVAVDSSSEEENVDSESDNPDHIGKDLTLIVKCFNRYKKKNHFQKNLKYNSKSASGSNSSNGNSWYKCKKNGHFIVECPLSEMILADPSVGYTGMAIRSEVKQETNLPRFRPSLRGKTLILLVYIAIGVYKV